MIKRFDVFDHIQDEISRLRRCRAEEVDDVSWSQDGSACVHAATAHTHTDSFLNYRRHLNPGARGWRRAQAASPAFFD